MQNLEVPIRKYYDRRLYDTGASRYVKLDDIACMVRNGSDVRALVGRVGKDVIHIILTQIVTETCKASQIALPPAAFDSTLDLYHEIQNFLNTRLSEAKNRRPRSNACATWWQATRGDRRRRAAKSNNSAVTLRKCSRAQRTARDTASSFNAVCFLV